MESGRCGRCVDADVRLYNAGWWGYILSWFEKGCAELWMGDVECQIRISRIVGRKLHHSVFLCVLFFRDCVG